MAIVKKIIDDHKGRIWAGKCQRGEGTQCISTLRSIKMNRAIA